MREHDHTYVHLRREEDEEEEEEEVERSRADTNGGDEEKGISKPYLFLALNKLEFVVSYSTTNSINCSCGVY